MPLGPQRSLKKTMLLSQKGRILLLSFWLLGEVTVNP